MRQILHALVIAASATSITACTFDGLDEQDTATDQGSPIEPALEEAEDSEHLDSEHASEAVASSLEPAAPVITNGGCNSLIPCGEVQNNTSMTIRVSLNWTCSASSAPLGSSCPQAIQSVAAGAHKGGGSVDVDAFEVPSGCTLSGNVNGFSFTRSAGWYKFSNLQTVTVTSASCVCLLAPCFQ